MTAHNDVRVVEKSIAFEEEEDFNSGDLTEVGRAILEMVESDAVEVEISNGKAQVRVEILTAALCLIDELSYKGFRLLKKA